MDVQATDAARQFLQSIADLLGQSRRMTCRPARDEQLGLAQQIVLRRIELALATENDWQRSILPGGARALRDLAIEREARRDLCRRWRVGRLHAARLDVLGVHLVTKRADAAAHAMAQEVRRPATHAPLAPP